MAIFNATTIKTAFANLNAWRQNDDPNGIQLSSVATPSSGLYYNDEHPLLTINNIAAAAPDFINFDSPTASATFTAWLNNKTQAAIVKALNAWVNRKFEMRSGRTLLDSQQIIKATGSQDQDFLEAGNFAGFSINPRRSDNLLLTIHEIGLQFTQAQPALTLYFFRSDKPETPQTLEVNYNTPGDVQWFSTTFTADAKGEYFIGYLKDDIAGASLNGTRDYGAYNTVAHRIPHGNYFTINAATAPCDGSALWPLTSTKYTDITNYGVNLRVSVACDYTNFFVQQKAIFAELVLKAVAKDLLAYLPHNPSSRVNRNTRTIDKDLLIFDLNGDPQGRASGLGAEYEQALNSITFNYSQIDKICMPCKQQSVIYTSAR